jgi:hypothetical protein
MLPNIRVVLGAVVAAVVLLAMSFALVATFRVAQDTRIGMLQADLAQRGRSFIPASEESRPALLADQPAPLEANPVAAVEIQDAPEIPKEAPETPMGAVLAVPQGEPRATELPVAELPATQILAIEPPSAEPPMGGPLVQDTFYRSGQPTPQAVDEIAAQKAKKKAEQAAAKKARAQRLARERKAAARKARAALDRAKQQSASSFGNAPPGNSFGTFNNGTSGNSPLPNGTFGNGTFGTSASGQ